MYLWIIVIIIIIILLYLLSLSYFYLKYNIQYLSIKEGCNLINRYHQNYFIKMKKKESIIRNCDKYDCISYYCNHIQLFTNIEKLEINSCVLYIKNYYYKYYPNLNRLPWNFIKVSNQIEGGMPHTIYNTIILPQNFIDKLHTSIQNKNINTIINYFCKILIHEHIHIYQKLYPTRFKELYTQYWNFIPYPKLKLPNNILKKQRINPDGYDKWIYQLNDNILLYPDVILRDNPKNLDDVEKIGILINKKNNKIIKIKKLNQINQFNYFFCNVSQNYHPHEISAIVISEYIINKNYYNYCDCLKKCKKWLNQYL